MEEGNETLQGFLEKSLKLASLASSYLLNKEMERGLSTINKLVPMQLANKLLPYFVAAGILDLSGKDITKNNIERMFVGADVEINRIILTGIGMLKYKNHLVYVLSIVFLVSAEKDVTMERLLNTVMSLDVDPDVEVAREAVKVYNELAPQVGLGQIKEI
ncbi:MAG: hypothetical protein ACP5K9_01120 [Candidatus Micrarchaeia archaeon]